MKKLWASFRRLTLGWRIAFTVLIIMIILATTLNVYSSTIFHQIPVTVEVISAVPDVKIYSTPDATAPLAGIQFAGLHQGQTSEVLTFYAVNKGVLPQACSIMITEGTSQAWGTITLTPTNLGQLNPGGSASFTISVTANVNTPPGTHTVTLALFQTGT